MRPGLGNSIGVNQSESCEEVGSIMMQWFPLLWPTCVLQQQTLTYQVKTAILKFVMSSEFKVCWSSGNSQSAGATAVHIQWAS